MSILRIVDREPLEVGEAAEARAEVVERDARPHRDEALHEFLARPRCLDISAVSVISNVTSDGSTPGARHGLDHPQQPEVAERPRGEIHLDGRPPAARSMPCSITQRSISPISPYSSAAGRKLPGATTSPSPLSRHPQQSSRGPPRRVHVDDRLAVEHEAILVQRGSHPSQPFVGLDVREESRSRRLRSVMSRVITDRPTTSPPPSLIGDALTETSISVPSLCRRLPSRSSRPALRRAPPR